MQRLTLVLGIALWGLAPVTGTALADADQDKDEAEAQTEETPSRPGFTPFERKPRPGQCTEGNWSVD